MADPITPVGSGDSGAPSQAETEALYVVPADINNVPAWAVSKAIGKKLAETVIEDNPGMATTDEEREGLEILMAIMMRPVCKQMFPMEYAKEMQEELKKMGGDDEEEFIV